MKVRTKVYALSSCYGANVSIQLPELEDSVREGRLYVPEIKGVATK